MDEIILEIKNKTDNGHDIYDIYLELIKSYHKEDINLIYYHLYKVDYTSCFSIKEQRLKQQEFRMKVINRDKYCILSKSHPDMCEACHIIPYSECDEGNIYNINNGILLESGLHKLFDKYEWSINPNKKTVELSPKLLNDNSYGLIKKYHNKKVSLNDNVLINLKDHYEKFKSINKI